MLIWKAKGYNAFYDKLLTALKQDRSELIQNTSVRTFGVSAHLLSRDMLVDMR